jgi:hypothetical protein
MSFSKTFTGAKLAVLAAIAAFPAEQKAIDEGYAGTKPGVIEGHAKQIELGAKAVNAALADVADEAHVEAGLWGHANNDGAGNYGFRVNSGGLTEALPQTE